MPENYFFEIPIYRCTPERHDLEIKEQIAKIKDMFSSIYNGRGIDYTDAENRVIGWETVGYDYNEVIGWIKLYILGSQIRGEYFFETKPREKRKIKRRYGRALRKQHFIWIGKAFEMNVNRNLSSIQILEKLILKLESLSKHERPFKGRYIDLRQLRNVGKYIDWRSLMTELNPLK